MPRHDLLRRRRFPKSAVRHAWQLAAVLLTVMLLSACSLPSQSPPCGETEPAVSGDEQGSLRLLSSRV
jgi:hypothetical protein